MIFAAPWVLLALPALPLLWWLLRVTPPAPRSEIFPAIRLLMGLHAREETPARTPWWLLLLRMVAATLVILALARPVLDAGSTLAGSRAGAAGGGQRLGLGRRLAAPDAGGEHRAGSRRARRAAGGAAGHRAGRVPAPRRRPPRRCRSPICAPRLAALHPEPWPPDRAAAATALRAWHQPGAAVVYLGDGLTHGGDFAAFAAGAGERRDR